ncbi:unnamed protein product [Rotaria sp. Silwood2]|nr:unnamed protein product [Rotaria sp. Silwood2]
MANPEQIPGFRGISQRDSPIGYTKQSKWYTKIELAKLYPTDTFSARFDIWNLSKMANSGRNPRFPDYTKQSKWYTKIHLDKLYRMNTFSTRSDLWNPSETANPGRNSVFRGISQRDSPIGYTKPENGIPR